MEEAPPTDAKLFKFSIAVDDWPVKHISGNDLAIGNDNLTGSKSLFDRNFKMEFEAAVEVKFELEELSTKL